MKCVIALFALSILTGAVLLTFQFILSAEPGTISGRYDIYRYYGPITFYLDYCLEHGEFPLWNPLVYCGLPNAANPQSFVYYPPNLLRSFLMGAVSPQATAVSLIVLMGLHLILMGAFTFLLARAHRMSLAAALTAALVWTCSALIVRRACEYHFLYTITWLPLILYLVKQGMDTRKIGYCVALTLSAGLLLGMAILGGFLQIVSYMGVSIGVYALFYRVLLAPDPVLGANGLPARRFLTELLLFGALFLVAGGIAAVLLGPTTELASFSARQKGMAVPMYSDLMQWTITRLYQSIVVFPGMKYEAETLRGAGVIALLLAACSVFHTCKRSTALFGLLAYALVDCGFGPPFPIASLVNILTPFSSSAYSRSFDFALLPLGMLAGLGVDSLLRPAASNKVRLMQALVLLYGAAATLIPLYQWVFPKFFLPVQEEVITVPLIAVGIMLFVLLAPIPRPQRSLALLLLPVLLFAETWSWNHHYIPWMVNEYQEKNPPLQEGHHFPTANSRGTGPIANRDLYSLTPVMNGVDPLHFAEVRDLLSGEPRDKRAHRLVTDWEPTAENSRGNLFLKRFFWLSSQMCIAPLPGKKEVYPTATTVFLSSRPSTVFPEVTADQLARSAVSERAVRVEVPGVEQLLQSQSTGKQLRHNLNFRLPEVIEGVRAGTAGALHATLVYTFRSEAAAQIDTVFNDRDTNRSEWGFRHRIAGGAQDQTVQVPLPDMANVRAELTVKPSGSGVFQFVDIHLLVDPADEDSHIAIEAFSANEVRLKISDLPGPRALSFMDAFYPGWTVTVDGVLAPLHRANDAFKAVLLDAGAHEVRFTFSSRPMQRGLLVTLATLAASLIIIAGCLVLARRSPGEAIPVDVPPPSEPPSAAPPARSAAFHESLERMDSVTFPDESDSDLDDPLPSEAPRKPGDA
ncbi:MAG: hypothetical protein HYV27_16395 [Candidatus Hydrogenedentes bacterium]|nr:hypothetical protein [Candidatus Hydrogenedentota bacterium]